MMLSSHGKSLINHAKSACFSAVTLMVVAGSGVSQEYRPDLLGQYEHRAAVADEQEVAADIVQRLPPVPLDFTAWWEVASDRTVRSGTQPAHVDLNTLLIKSLQHSAQIKVFSELPLIRETAIQEADAAFDWRAFVDTRWNDISEPVGSLLTTGTATRFRDHQWTYNMGLRTRNRSGGEFEIGQRFGWQDNNSDFFIPKDQGTAQLSLNYTHPLLRGGGKYYNCSAVVLAQIDAGVAKDEFLRQLQSQLLEVSRAYWELYLERGALMQKRRLAQRAAEILRDLEGRKNVDADMSQIVRARAAVTSRQSDLIRAETAIANAESRIHALVNDPEMTNAVGLELVPTDQPLRDWVPVSMQASLSTAIQRRPEVGQALKQIKAASVRMDMSENELLPVLNAVVETYVSGLEGDSDIGGAYVNQFNEGEPSYRAGLDFEMPLGNRAACARYQRRRLELRQLENQLRVTMETLLLEVKVAVREVSTSYREMQALFQAMASAAQQVDYIQNRWKHLPGDSRTAGLYLEDLLAAQERLAESEQDYLRASVTYNLALTNLKRARGELLDHEHVSHGVTCFDGLPQIILDKANVVHEAVVVPQQVPAHVPAPAPAAAASVPRYQAVAALPSITRDMPARQSRAPQVGPATSYSRPTPNVNSHPMTQQRRPNIGQYPAVNQTTDAVRAWQRVSPSMTQITGPRVQPQARTARYGGSYQPSINNVTPPPTTQTRSAWQGYQTGERR